MLRKITLGTLAAATALTALPAAADAQGRHRGYYGRHDGGGYDRGYRRGYGGGDYYRYRYYRPRSYTRVYVGPAYYPGYYDAYPAYYGGGYYRGGGYYGRGYYDCDDGTSGAIVGGAAGALVGREIGRNGRGYRYRYHRGGGTTGAIIGGAIGALVGREATRC